MAFAQASGAVTPIAAQPYMGWDSWDTIGAAVNETLVKQEADYMALHLRAAGYTYINIDRGWQLTSAISPVPAADPSRFPNGIGAIANYVHSKGLLLGLYLNFGAPGTNPLNCGGPGIIPNLEATVTQLAVWGVDLVKLGCVVPPPNTITTVDLVDLTRLKQAIARTGRRMWVELDQVVNPAQLLELRPYFNDWLINSAPTRTSAGILHAFSVTQPPAGPGGWNFLGNLDLAATTTADEQRTAQTLWAISCSPISIGTDLRTLSAASLAMLTSPEVIAVDQAGHVAKPISPAANQQVWSVKNPDGSFTVALFNLASTAAVVSVSWTELGFSGSAAVRDLWAQADLGNIPNGYSHSIPSHGSMLLKVTPLGAADFELTLAPEPTWGLGPVLPGGSITTYANITPLGGFAGTVALSISGLPAGAKATFVPSTISVSGSSALTISTSTSTPVGAYTITVKGVSGSLTHTVSTRLTVGTTI